MAPIKLNAELHYVNATGKNPRSHSHYLLILTEVPGTCLLESVELTDLEAATLSRTFGLPVTSIIED